MRIRCRIGWHAWTPWATAKQTVTSTSWAGHTRSTTSDVQTRQCNSCRIEDLRKIVARAY